ncbi:MAG: polyphenol oxidase family protein [Treponema sp.]|nr:polyphenol oxidase family protein [Treponema sp.]
MKWNRADSLELRIYPFTLDFFPLFPGARAESPAGQPALARFSFILDGSPVPGPVCAISSRSAGNMVYSPQRSNPARDRLFAALGLDPRRVFACVQSHSQKVLSATGTNPGNLEGDGLVSADPSACLTVTAADCLPVYLFDTGSGAFGIVHSGWKGTGIVFRALLLMEERWETRPAAVTAVLGPCIRSCCYHVDEERARLFKSQVEAQLSPGGEIPGIGAAYPLVRGSGELDMQAANIRLLAAAGVRHIAVCGNCTFTDERLGSYRREGPGFSRMAALIGRF